MTGNKKAAGAGAPQAAFTTNSKTDFIAILANMKVACHRLSVWLCAVGVA